MSVDLELDGKVTTLIKLEDLLKDLDTYEQLLFLRGIKERYKIYAVYDAYRNRYKVITKEGNNDIP